MDVGIRQDVMDKIRTEFQSLCTIYNEELNYLIQGARDGYRGLVTESQDRHFKELDFREDMNKYFSSDTPIAHLLNLIIAMDRDLKATTDILFIKWYYQLVLIAMASVLANKVNYMIESKTNEQVYFDMLGSSCDLCLIGMPGYRMLDNTRQQVWSKNYCYINFRPPVLDDVIAEYKKNPDINSFIQPNFTVGIMINDIHSKGIFNDFSLTTNTVSPAIKDNYLTKIKEILSD